MRLQLRVQQVEMVAAEVREAQDTRGAGIEAASVAQESVIVDYQHRHALVAGELGEDPGQGLGLRACGLGVQVDARNRCACRATGHQGSADIGLRDAAQFHQLEQPDR